MILAIFNTVLSVRQARQNLFHSLDISKKFVNECKALGIDEESLKAYCVAWQWEKPRGKLKRVGVK